MKFAFSSNAFVKYTLLETIDMLADLGYEGIEIMADVPHAYPPDLSDEALLEIRDRLNTYGMKVSNINAFMLHAIGDVYHPSWIERDPSQRVMRIEHTLQCIDLAAQLGASTLSTEPGGPLGGMGAEEGLRLFREGLVAIEGRAKEKGVRILIEPEPDLLIEKSGQFQRFFEGLDPAVFGLNFDIGHFFCVGEDPAPLIRQMTDVIWHFHLEDIAPSREHRHLMLGEGAIDIPVVLDTIEASGYDGFVTVELYPYEDQPLETAKKAMAYLNAWRDGQG